jgi:hypothetical protein
VSSTSRGRKRTENDAYYTPYELAVACIERLEGFCPADQIILEPHAGDGVWIDAVEAFTYTYWAATPKHVIANDTDDKHLAPRGDWYRTCRCDFRQLRGLYADWIIGNPPWVDLESHIDAALRIAPNVAFLLRLNFLGSYKRIGWWHQKRPSEVHIVVPRPSFTSNRKTDSCEYALFVWDETRDDLADIKLDWLSWDKPRKGNDDARTQARVDAEGRKSLLSGDDTPTES